MRFLPVFTLVRSRRALLPAVLCSAAWLLSVASQVSAQSSAAEEPPLVQLDSAAPPAPPAAAPAPAASAAAELTRQLLALEQQTQELEFKRAQVRTLGYRIGKIVCWSASAVFLVSALGWFQTAESVHKALKDGRDDEAYDVNRNDKVTKHDEDIARRVSRTLAITSLVPIGLGVFTTLFHMRREREKRDLTRAIDDLSTQRRGLLRRLDAQLSASPTHAGLSLRTSF